MHNKFKSDCDEFLSKQFGTNSKNAMAISWNRLHWTTRQAIREMASCAATGHPPEKQNRNAMRWWKRWMVKGEK